MNFNFFKKSFFSTLLVFFAFIAVAHAANPGVIVSPNTSARLLSDDSEINFNCTNCGIQVTDSSLTGYVWGTNIGWINLAPSQGGVSNDGNGTLSGYAWGQNTGWVNFSPTNGGVSISTTTGEFSGYAWSQNYGWIKFLCPGNACVVTDWAPVVPSSGNPTTGNVPPVDFCPNDPGIQTSTSQCVVTLVDVCPNDAGIQTSLSDCTVPPLDVCPDDVGIQTLFSQCTIPPVDLCPDEQTDPGFQLVLPCNVGTQACLAIFTDPVTGDPSCTNPTISGNSTGGGGGGGNVTICLSGDPDCEPPSPTNGQVVSGSSNGGSGTNTPGSIGNFIAGISDSIAPVLADGWNSLMYALETPEGEITANVLVLLGFVAGASVLASKAPYLSLGLIPLRMFIFRIWSLLLSIFGLSRKNWGIVYNSVTKKAIESARVVIRDMQGQDVGVSLTDIAGHFRFSLNPGTYRIFASKPGYGEFHTTGEIIIDKSGEIINRDIPMNPIDLNSSENIKGENKLKSFYSDKWILAISNVLFIVGFVVAAFNLLLLADLQNILVVSFYGLILILRQLNIFGPKKVY